MFHRIFLFGVLFHIAITGQTALDLKRQAAALKAKGDAAGALALTVKAAEADPKSAELEDEIGFLLAVLNRGAEAIPHFEHAIELQSSYAAAHFHLGVLYWLAKDPNRAIPSLQEAVKLAPKVADYHVKLGSAFSEVAHYEESVSELRTATRLEPRNASRYRGPFG